MSSSKVQKARKIIRRLKDQLRDLTRQLEDERSKVQYFENELPPSERCPNCQRERSQICPDCGWPYST